MLSLALVARSALGVLGCQGTAVLPLQGRGCFPADPQQAWFDHLRQNQQLELCKSPQCPVEHSAGREGKVNGITERIPLPGSVLWGSLEKQYFPISAASCQKWEAREA